MKWPSYLMLIRHDVSHYNILRIRKAADPLYQEFCQAFERQPDEPHTQALVEEIKKKYCLNCNDAETPLADPAAEQARRTGEQLRQRFETPDIVFVSPYIRTIGTLIALVRGWPALGKVKTYEEERIREQEHGLANLYNDWRIFQTLHPEQRIFYNLMGPYYYQYPQGESVCDVRKRVRSMLDTVIRDFAEKKVLLICHHLTILSLRANLERLSAKEFLRLDEKEKPINCGVTVYRGHPELGQNGQLVLDFYNKKYY